MDEVDDFARGWAFYVGGGAAKGQLLPSQTTEWRDWIQGFCSALADYGLGDDPKPRSIAQALSANGIHSEALEACLSAAQGVRQGGVWCRWPDMPIVET